MVQYIAVTDTISDFYPPTLIANGNQDLIVQSDQSRALAKMLGAYLVELKGVGYSPHMEAPDAFNHIITAFLTETN